MHRRRKMISNRAGESNGRLEPESLIVTPRFPEAVSGRDGSGNTAGYSTSAATPAATKLVTATWMPAALLR